MVDLPRTTPLIACGPTAGATVPALTKSVHALINGVEPEIRRAFVALQLRQRFTVLNYLDAAGHRVIFVQPVNRPPHRISHVVAVGTDHFIIRPANTVPRNVTGILHMSLQGNIPFLQPFQMHI